MTRRRLFLLGARVLATPHVQLTHDDEVDDFVVLTDVPAGHRVAGVPARLLPMRPGAAA